MQKDNLEPRQITFPGSLWEALEELAPELNLKDKRGNHSKLVRAMVSAGVVNWQESPYVGRSSRLTILVTGQGHVFYHLVQVLRLNSRRERLPFVLEMKPEKRGEYRDRAEENEAAWFRDLWLLNHFAAWQGEDPDELALLSSYVDRGGTDSKIADLPVHQPAGRVLTREVISGLRDYVQWQADEPGLDRVDFPIDVPTQNLEVTVVVDADLYRHTVKNASQIADLDVEFRNREGARFDVRELGRDPENRIDVHRGKCLGPEHAAKAELVQKALRELDERVRAVAEGTVKDDGPVLDDAGREKLNAAFRLPERFLFHHLQWPLPYLGIEVCVHWEKPRRGEPG